ncbi:hypothetical protein AGMMS49928_28570 [Spirochaetia bacterium]|nr:hypothetical protein AGMMS49928_28570 [Spirochaetia bacterium]
MKQKIMMIFTMMALAALLAALAAGCLSFAVVTGPYEDGVYEGSGVGYRGLVHVRLRVEGGGIADIEIVDHGEDLLVGGAAMEELLEAALYADSTDLDAVSGATESSAGFLEALEDALAKARPRL